MSLSSGTRDAASAPLLTEGRSCVRLAWQSVSALVSWPMAGAVGEADQPANPGCGFPPTRTSVETAAATPVAPARTTHFTGRCLLWERAETSAAWCEII